MSSRKSQVLIVAALAAVAASSSSSCATAPPKKEVVWPKPPDKARIRFVRAYKHTQDLETGNWVRFWRMLTGPSGDPKLNQPMGLAISDDAKRLYIADYGLNTVMVANFEANALRPFTDEPMGRPFDVKLDGEGNVYVSQSAGKVVAVYNGKGESQRLIGQGQFERPTGLALDRERKLLYVADSASLGSNQHLVRVFSLDGKHLRDLGPPDGAKPGKGNGDGQFYFPSYLALDREGKVYVGDAMNFRVQVFDADGKFVRKYGEHGDGPGAFARIKGLAFDGFGNLHVVDAGLGVVQVFNTNFELLTFYGGFAQKIEYFDLPSGVEIDRKTNRIYACNAFNSRIIEYEMFDTTAEDSFRKKDEPPAAAPADVKRTGGQ